ncbi:MAG: hypothetical protein EBZ40_05810 [Gammaproteobacteria bacterium]|nr:hypothetical protein [Gammaproteobacteria bacterium]
MDITDLQTARRPAARLASLVGLALLALLTQSACSSRSPVGPPPTVIAEAARNTDAGRVIGFANTAGGHTWLGIPYAAPPVGALRWRPPAAPAPWSNDRQSNTAGSPCIQFGSSLGGVGADGSRQGDEDCLYLNVYAPRLAPAEAATTRLPVIVWVHGGSNVVGHAAFYDGSALAARERAIVVMINYRLGPFGWFALPGAATANFGNLDVLAALHWVQRNAAAFGGDPGNVTAIGESAGATNVLALLLMPEARGLLHRAVVQSLGFGFGDREVAARAAKLAIKELLIGQRRARDDADAERLLTSWSTNETAEFLRTLDPWTVYGAFSKATVDEDRLPTVIQDDVSIRAGDVRRLMASPETHLDIPLLLGTNRDEPKIFMAFESRHTRLIAGLPIAIRDPAAYDREARYRALVWKADGVDSIAEAITQAANDGPRNRAAVFAYRWDWDEQGRAYGLLDVSKLIGAAHAMEIPFVFGHFDLGPQSDLLFNAANEAGRLQLSSAMMSYWAAFARSGDPGNGGRDDLPRWTPWVRAATPGERLMVFATAARGGVRMQDDFVSRELVLQKIRDEPLQTAQRCDLFRATFRNRRDAWADVAWQRYAAASCAGARVARTAGG